MSNETKSRGPGYRGPYRLREAGLKKEKIDKQANRLLTEFLNSGISAPHGSRRILQSFIEWLEERGCRIISGEAVFCVPFSHLVEKSKLKS